MCTRRLRWAYPIRALLILGVAQLLAAQALAFQPGDVPYRLRPTEARGHLHPGARTPAP